MGPFEMVLGIVLITAVVGLLRAKWGIREDKHGNYLPAHDPDADRMREEIKTLKERIAVLERLATDTNSAVALDREIEKLR